MTHFPQLSAFRGGNGIVRVIGHRGAREIMPENTLEGFEFALRVGVETLELDVVLTADRVPVITHNHRMSSAATRTSDGRWIEGAEPKVSSQTLAQLQQLDVGGLDWTTVYGQRFPDQAFLSGVQVPRLTALLDLVAKPDHEGVTLLLELKSDPCYKDDALERAQVVSAIVNDVRAYGLQHRTVLHSFDWGLLRECRRQAPEIPTSYLSQMSSHGVDPHEDSPLSVSPNFDDMAESLPQAVALAGGQLWSPYFLDVAPELVDEAHALGLVVLTWTVNERDDIFDMIDAGVDGIVTDHPGRAQRCLLERGLHWREPKQEAAVSK